MFAKNTLASAVAAAIGVTAVGTAQAGTAFWPYVAISDTVTTIVSVVNRDANNWTADGTGVVGGGDRLHYRFFYKAPSAALTDSCLEYDEYLPTSQSDIQTIDLGGIYGADTLGVLFKDPSVNNDWKTAGLDFALGRNVKPARGYLLGDTFGNFDTLRGEAFIFEFGTGAAWGYEAYHQGRARGTGNWYDFRWAASESPSQVSLMPLSEMTTAFFVTPVDYFQNPDQNSYRARIDIWTKRGYALFDRDEGLVSGTVAKDVTCVGRVEAGDLLSDGARARVADTGGWANLWNYRVVNTGAGWVPAAWADAWNIANHVLNQTYGFFGSPYAYEGAAADLPYLDSDRYLVAAEDNGWNAEDREQATVETQVSAQAFPARPAGTIYPFSWLRGAVVIKLEYNQPGASFNGETIGDGNVINNGIMYAPPQWRY